MGPRPAAAATAKADCSIPTRGGTPTVLYSFDHTDHDPAGNLAVSPDGSTLYGATSDGGAYSDGTIFSLPASGGTPTILFSSSYSDSCGEEPAGSLASSQA